MVWISRLAITLSLLVCVSCTQLRGLSKEGGEPLADESAAQQADASTRKNGEGPAGGKQDPWNPSLQSDYEYLDLNDLSPEEQLTWAAQGARGEDGDIEGGVDATPANIWNRIRAGFALDLVNQTNPRIDSEQKWYASHQSYLDRTFGRSALYLHHIVNEAEKRKMPLELALLPVVESAFDPFAYSHGRASGIWQFIPSTGKHFGLQQNWWYDGRRDIVASTDAALTYLQKLSDMFDGDWLLALAAYNSGAGTVMRAIKKNQAKGLPTDYWSLSLPRETSMYVPRLLAIAKVVADPDNNGVTLVDIADEPYFGVVELDSQIDLAQAAKLAQIDVDDLYVLNPGYNQWATAPLGPHRLALPLPQLKVFEDAYANTPKKQLVNWTRYKVRQGDTLITIAKHHKTTPEVVQEVNRLKGALIRVGQQLLIPSSYEGEDFYSLSADNRLEAKQSKQVGGNGTAKVEHVVKAGDTLWDIAQDYKVNVRKLARWNGMAPGDVLSPGKTLVIWTKSGVQQTAKASSPSIKNRQVIRKIGYKIRSGDSLYRIASRFNVSVNDLLRWNSINKGSVLRPGQRLSIYVDVTQIN
ncbi:MULTISPECIES: LysM peptidoglycan-binding domain-containing protein [unclassified Hahella]|uniref:LysM peptidoglycan-binding domain-containing protein n=1 Tax=unclassified Hahella TaxID=2624107 RepID=UPI001C1EC8D5|nr:MULTISPECIES: LysM peptidoglycan-binding domain-containing protein [unclassified Hahella]MBU6950887.1 LysM peptidoglycan-binding domain-containing protein [Hahella sp. HN01]MDG9667219.1 LysM peptidoglycan-binding domain-containing protein [Hahella sp. CR1]